MNVTKDAYFYFKLENDLDTVYPDGWHGWYMDYFKEYVHVARFLNELIFCKFCEQIMNGN